MAPTSCESYPPPTLPTAGVGSRTKRSPGMLSAFAWLFAATMNVCCAIVTVGFPAFSIATASLTDEAVHDPQRQMPLMTASAWATSLIISGGATCPFNGFSRHRTPLMR